MGRAEDYRAKAEDAEARATRALGDIERAAYWRISQGWRDLEADAEARARREAAAPKL
jgi:hypothetical protein